MIYLTWLTSSLMLGAGLVGLLFGWLIWGLSTRQLQKKLTESYMKLTQMGETPGKLREMETRYSALVAEKEEEAVRYSSRSADLKNSLAAKEAEVDQLRMDIFQADANHRTERAQYEANAGAAVRVQQLEKELIDLEAGHKNQMGLQEGTIAQLRGRVQELEAAQSAMPTPAVKTMSAAAGFAGDASASSGVEVFNDGAKRVSKDEDQISLAEKNAEVKHLHGLIATLLQPLNDNDIAQRAFQLGQHRDFRNGSETEDWLKAERQLYNERMDHARADLNS